MKKYNKEIKNVIREFKKKFKQLTNEEIEQIDQWFLEIEDQLLDFYGLRKEIITEEQKQRLIDFLYMYAIAYDHYQFDERYDQPIFLLASIYAGII
jgi:hypothetical protein